MLKKRHAPSLILLGVFYPNTIRGSLTILGIGINNLKMKLKSFKTQQIKRLCEIHEDQDIKKK